MYKEYSRKEWAEAFDLYQENLSTAEISRKTGISVRCLNRRIQQYRDFGVWQADRLPYTRSTPVLKRCVIDDVLRQSLSYGEITAKYGISFTCLETWLRKYRHGGYEELFATKPKGRPPKMHKKKKPAKEMTELERLQEENAYLKAEVAYLKKLKALDQEENAEMFGIGPRQSED